MRNRDKKSYPQHEGTILQWTYSRNDGDIKYVKIVGMDFNIGYTLVNADNEKNNKTCVNGPLAPNKSEYWNSERYEQEFQYLLDCVRNKKVYDVDERNKITGHKPSSSNLMNSCSFSS